MKKFNLILVTMILSLLMGITAFAAEGWRGSYETGWWYENADGSYPTSCWKNIDGADYYFDQAGWMLADMITPDGYYVMPNGAWDGQPAFSTSKQEVGNAGDLNGTWVDYNDYYICLYEGNQNYTKFTIKDKGNSIVYSYPGLKTPITMTKNGNGYHGTGKDEFGYQSDWDASWDEMGLLEVTCTTVLDGTGCSTSVMLMRL